MVSALFFTWFFAAVLWTVNALRKPVPPGRGIAPLWLPGMLISELAPWYLVVRSLVAAGFVALGGLQLSIGQAGLAMFAVSQLGLSALIRRTVRSVHAAGGRVTLTDLFRTRIGLPAGVEKVEGLAYRGDLTLDLYRRTVATSAPTLIYVHSGSWMRGRPGRQALPLLYRLVDAGWVVLDIRYPLSPAATFPEHLIAVKWAIAWAKTHGRAWGVDPSRVALAGASSGAHLAALAALTWDRAELQPGFEEEDTSVVACVPHYGIYDFLVRNRTRLDWPFIARHVLKAERDQAPDLYRLGSPLDQVRPDAPPFLLIHGSHDSLVLPAESHHFAEALRTAGARAVYHEVEGAQHGFDAIASARTRAVAVMASRFLEEAAEQARRRVS